MIAIIDYDAGNTMSVINAIKRLDADYLLTADPKKIVAADKVILPGVGHAAAAMEQLIKRKLADVIHSITQPFLGVCVGMQLMYDYSEEGNTPCLGIVEGSIVRFHEQEGMKIPHMGWNENWLKESLDGGLLHGMEGEETYFVHSFYAPVSKDTVAICDYFYPFTSYVRKANFHGLQFHPEKSGLVGEKIIQNFLTL